MNDQSHVYEVVRACVADSLALDLADVRLQARLAPDLGADSLDLVDIIFTLEKKLGIKLRETEIDFLSRLDFSSPDVVREGALTPATLEKLSGRLPALATVPDPARVTPAQLFALVTVETLCILVLRQLDLQNGERDSPLSK